jgi:hypothetical protein
VNVFEVAAIVTLCALAWLALGRFRQGRVQGIVLIVGALLIIRSLSG